MATSITLSEFGKGNVERLRFTITKRNAAGVAIAWNLATGSVALTFEKPDRETQFSRAAVAESAIGGIFYYDTTTTDLDTAGYWTLSVTVTDGAVVKKYPHSIGFYVAEEP